MRALPRLPVPQPARFRVWGHADIPQKTGDYARAAQEMGPRLCMAKALRKADVYSGALRQLDVRGDWRKSMTTANDARRAISAGHHRFRRPARREPALNHLPLAAAEGVECSLGIAPNFDAAFSGIAGCSQGSCRKS